MSDEKDFQTTAALGSTISGIGWFVVVASVIAGIALASQSSKYREELNIAGGIAVAIGGGALGIFIVCLGQLLQIAVAIEHNTRKGAKRGNASEESLGNKFTECPQCGKTYKSSAAGGFCEDCGHALNEAKPF